jgi:hypothetical protein
MPRRDPGSKVPANSAVPVLDIFYLNGDSHVSLDCRAHHMPKHASNLLAVLLVSLIATAALLGQGSSAMPVVHERPGGCHRHGSAVPPPVSYRCCESGHDSALLQISFTLHPDAAGLASAVEVSKGTTRDITHQGLCHLATSSADPPAIAPLRI